MSDDLSATLSAEEAGAKGRRRPRELRIALDTNVLYESSGTDLIRQELADLVSVSTFPDLKLIWHVPEVVRHERQYQMQHKALELLIPLGKLEKLLGHNLNITQELLIESVEKLVSKRQEELGFLSSALDYTKVDWARLMLDATYRRPPFKAGKVESGFRDALVLETFLQLVAASPRTPGVCRIVLVTEDAYLAQAVQDRIASHSNVRVLSSIEDLRGFINTLASQVDERYVVSWRAKAEKLFFVKKSEDTLFYRAGIREEITEKFKEQLTALPEGATLRENNTWYIGETNFVRKDGQRVFWSTRIKIQTQAFELVVKPNQSVYQPLKSVLAPGGRTVADLMASMQPTSINSPLSTGLGLPPSIAQQFYLGPEKILRYEGNDIYDVLWSVEVTTSHDMRRQKVEDFVHVGTEWEMPAQQR